MIFELRDLNIDTAELLSDRCRSCGWWQGHDGYWDSTQASYWAETAMESFGSWGKLALGDGQLLGMIQYGPAGLFPRASDFPCGPVSVDAVLLSCGTVAAGALASVKRSLVTALIAEFHQRQIPNIEAFTIDTGSQEECRFFADDFLRDCGFYPVRNIRGVKLMRLELGGVQTVVQPRRRYRLLERIKRGAPAPAPVALVSALPPAGPDHTLLQTPSFCPVQGCRAATACGGHG